MDTALWHLKLCELDVLPDSPSPWQHGVKQFIATCFESLLTLLQNKQNRNKTKPKKKKKPCLHTSQSCYVGKIKFYI